MIAFLLNLPSWAALAPAVLIIVAATLVLYAAPRRLWPMIFTVLGLLAACWLSLLVARHFYQAGSAAERATWQEIARQYVELKRAAADHAEDERQKAYGLIDQTADTYQEKRRIYYAARPAERDAVVFDVDRVRQIREARTAVAAAAERGAGGPADSAAGHPRDTQARLDEGAGR